MAEQQRRGEKSLTVENRGRAPARLRECGGGGKREEKSKAEGQEGARANADPPPPI